MADHFDLGGHSYPVTTNSPEAQAWFDRGLLWTYGYNHEEALATGFASTQAALNLADGLADWEAALVRALPARYPQSEPVEDMSPWIDHFADAMRAAFEAHPDSLEVRNIFAEALLNRTPWNMWDLKAGQPAEGGSILPMPGPIRAWRPRVFARRRRCGPRSRTAFPALACGGVRRGRAGGIRVTLSRFCGSRTGPVMKKTGEKDVPTCLCDRRRGRGSR